MKTKLYTNNIHQYLQCSDIIDFDNESVAQLADKLYSASNGRPILSESLLSMCVTTSHIRLTSEQTRCPARHHRYSKQVTEYALQNLIFWLRYSAAGASPQAFAIRRSYSTTMPMCRSLSITDLTEYISESMING